MTSVYAWFAGKLGWLVIVALLGAVILGQRAQVSNAKAATARAQLELANVKTKAAQDAQKATDAARAEETRREAEKQEVIDHARNETAVAQAAARDADAAAGKLRGQLAAYVSAARRSAEDPDAPSGSQAAGDPLGVLADVLGRADARAGVLAAFADASRIAGAACERYANGLQPQAASAESAAH